MKKDFIYLASASPRRRELLQQIGVRFEVLPAEIPEVQEAGEAPDAYVLRLARSKADAVWERVAARARAGGPAAEADGGGAHVADAEPRPVLAADTAVVIDGRVLGKPADTAEAMAMLAELSGRTHAVLTAVALRCGRSRLEALMCRSEVRFRDTTAEERAAYCRSGEPFDKAGGYGIQGRAAMFVEHLSGSYSSVVGLPLFETATLLERCGFELWSGETPQARNERRSAERSAVPRTGDARTA